MATRGPSRDTVQRWGRWWPAALLGLATIGAYGTVFYASGGGVLLPVIATNTAEAE